MTGDASAAPRPVVTVGVPVLNGERYLRQTLDALAAQTLKEIEVLVSDNASSDATPAIIRDFTARDRRFRALPSTERLGLPDNYNRPLAAARGEFFMWNAADDRARPGHLETCVAALRARPDATAAFSWVAHIDPAGAPLSSRRNADLDLVNIGPDQRIRLYFEWGLSQVTGIGAVMRTEQLRGLGGHPRQWAGDFIMAVSLAMRGPWIQIPEILYEERIHAERNSLLQQVDLATQLRSYQPGRLPHVVFPEWAANGRMYREIGNVDAPALVRLRAAQALFRAWTIPQRGLLANDIRRNAIYLARRGHSWLGRVLRVDEIVPPA